MKTEFIKRLIIFLEILFGVGILMFAIAGECFLETDDTGFNEQVQEYEGTWERLRVDGSWVTQEMPGKYSAKRNEIVTTRTVLPETIDRNTYLIFRSGKQDMTFTIGDELRQEYSNRENRWTGSVSAAAYVFLEITPEDAGKYLTVTSQTDSSYTGYLYTVYQGGIMAFWRLQFEMYGSELILALLLILCGLLSMIASVALSIAYKKVLELLYLAMGILISGMWLMTNGVFRQVIFSNLSVANDLAFYMVMLLPIPYMFYMNAIQSRRYETAYCFVGALNCVSFVLFTALHVTGVVDFTLSIKYIALVCAAALGSIGITLARDVATHRIAEYRLVAIGVGFLIFSAFLQFLDYFRRTSSFSAMFLSLGLMVMLALEIVHSIKSIREMEKERMDALSVSEAKGMFLANMSHEIRTPINTVLGMNAMVLRETSENHIREYAMDIQNAGQSLLSLINDILDFTKIESGKMEIIPVEYDVSSLIHDVVNMIASKAREKGLKFELHINEDFPSRLWGDDVRIRQVLINLLNNAVKYTDIGRVSLTVTAKVKEDEADIHFEVSDTGIGIKNEDMEKLFEAFSRIEETRNRTVEGTGLGISITSNLLHLMDSQLKVESEYGRGSTFYFDLHQKVMDAQPIGDLEQNIRNRALEFKYEESFVAPEARILVVDDNENNLKVFVHLLKNTKVQIDTADSGMRCLDLAAKKRYDIIFMDHMMPIMDGIETLRRIKEEAYPTCADSAVIALTANAISGAREMYLAEGFVDYLSKPIQPDKLERMILKYLPEEKILRQKETVEQIPQEMMSTPQGTVKEEGSSQNLQETEGLAQIEGISWEYAHLFCPSDDMLYEIVGDYYRVSPIEQQKLQEFWEEVQQSEDGSGAQEEALKNYRIKVHSMKSSSAMIGATVVSGLARVLEYAARDGRLEVIRSMHGIFMEEWAALRERMKEIFPDSSEQEVHGKADEGLIGPLLSALEQACDAMDVDTADAISSELRKYEYRDDIETYMNQIFVSVEMMEYDTVMNMIEKVRYCLKEGQAR